MNLLRRRFMQLAGGGAALGALHRLNPVADAPAKDWIARSGGRIPTLEGAISDVGNAYYDPVADCAKRIALLKAMPDWYFKDRYGDIGPTPDFRMMKSWQPWFQRQAEFDLHVKGMRQSLITKAKYELKSFLWRKAGKEFP